MWHGQFKLTANSFCTVRFKAAVVDFLATWGQWINMLTQGRHITFLADMVILFADSCLFTSS